MLRQVITFRETANCLSKLYTEEWMRCVGIYLTDCERYKKGAAARHVGLRLNLKCFVADKLGSVYAS